jgi:hypothetical protein
VRQGRLAELFGLAGFASYLLLVAGGNFAHDYYQLAVTPVACTLIPLGLDELVRRVTGGPVGAEMSGRTTAIVLFTLCALAFSTFVRSASFHSWYELETGQPELCRASEEFLEKEDLLLFVGYNSPQLMFCMDRKGWLLADHESQEERVLRAWRDGASVVVVRSTFQSEPLGRWMDRSGRLLFENREWKVLRLAHPDSAPPVTSGPEPTGPGRR